MNLTLCSNIPHIMNAYLQYRGVLCLTVVIVTLEDGYSTIHVSYSPHRQLPMHPEVQLSVPSQSS